MVHDAVAVREKQLQVWGVSDDPRWRLTIYEPLYGGKIFANNGGPALLDYMGAYAGLGPEHSVLELGSGMGDACEYVASHFGSRVTGVEMSTQQIERARERHRDRRSRGFDFVEADMLEWEPSERYDVVYFGDMLGVAQDRRAVLERVSSLAATGWGTDNNGHRSWTSPQRRRPGLHLGGGRVRRSVPGGQPRHDPGRGLSGARRDRPYAHGSDPARDDFAGVVSAQSNIGRCRRSRRLAGLGGGCERVPSAVC